MSAKRAIFELRTYALKPTHVSEYINLTKQKFHLRTSHSVLNGFWFHELGGTLNAATHIWQYESLAHRAEVRAALGKDPEWINQYVSKLLPCLASQVNKVCVGTESVSIEKILQANEQKNGVFQLVTAGKSDDLEVFVKNVEEKGNAEFLASFDTVIGAENERSLLFRYGNVDDTLHGVELKGQNSVVIESCKNFKILMRIGVFVFSDRF